jgi:hypothetical protein
MSPRAFAHPHLTPALILAWADAHHAATGRWPTCDLTPVAGGPAGLRWQWVNQALGVGARGLPGGDSLARLLARERGRPHQHARPRLSERTVLAWARAHRRRTGSWPRIHEGAVAGRPGETWLGVDQALRKGLRGLPGGDSLPRLSRRASPKPIGDP